MQNKLDIMSNDYDSFLDHRHHVETELQQIKSATEKISTGLALSTQSPAGQRESLSHQAIHSLSSNTHQPTPVIRPDLSNNHVQLSVENHSANEHIASDDESIIPFDQSADFALFSPCPANQPQQTCLQHRDSSTISNSQRNTSPTASNSRRTEFALSIPNSAIQSQSPSASTTSKLNLTKKNWALVAASIPTSFHAPSRKTHTYQISSSQLNFSGHLPTLSQPLPAIREAFIASLNQIVHLNLLVANIKSIVINTQASRPKLLVEFSDSHICNQIWTNRRLLHQHNLYPEQVLPVEDRRQRDIVLRFFHALRQPVDGPHQFHFNAFAQGHSIKIVDNDNNKHYYSSNNKLQPLEFLKSIGLASE